MNFQILHVNVYTLGDIQSVCPYIMSAKWKEKKTLDDKNMFNVILDLFKDKDVLSDENCKKIIITSHVPSSKFCKKTLKPK